MAILPILTVPNPLLYQKSRPVREDEFGPELVARMSDMAETMYAAPGVGLAAPQVGDSRRFVVVDPGEKAERGVHLYKMINPTIVERSKDFIMWEETCLSVPGLEVKVKRNNRVRVEWLDENGASQSQWFEEYPAVIVQHELDHLIGTVIAERTSAFKRRRWLKKREKVRSRDASYV